MREGDVHTVTLKPLFGTRRSSKMRALCVAVALTILMGLMGCGSDENAVMPDVKGKKLDVAKTAIKDAGIKDEVKVDGGGTFGVIKESNWEVCVQSPAAGEAVSGAPRLTVDRSCDGDAEPGGTTEPTETTETTDTTTEAAKPAAPETEKVLTTDNSKDLAALLKVSDNCDEKIGHFAAKYEDRTIEFDGSIVNLANHGDTKTRLDILVAPGNKGPNSTRGPAFKFEDVNTFDLNVTGSKAPSSVNEGDRFRFVARIVEYNPAGCLLLLQPVSTRAR